MMKHRVLAIHLAIALVAGAVGWWASSLRGITGEERHAALTAAQPKPGPDGKVHAGSPRRSAEKEKGRKPPAARPWRVPAPALEDPNVIQANADGSFRVPQALLDRVSMSPIDGDENLNRTEMRKLGFSPQECTALAEAVEKARAPWVRREAALAVKSPAEGEDKILIVPAWAGDKAGEKNLELAFREIAGDRYGLVGRGLEQATKQYVGAAPPRMISHRRTGSGGHYYQEIELNPERMGELGPTPGIEGFRVISSGSSSSWGSNKAMKRYAHLFPEAP